MQQDAAIRKNENGKARKGRNRLPQDQPIVPQSFGINIDDQDRQQEQAADRDFQEAVDADMVQAVVQHAQHEHAPAPAPRVEARTSEYIDLTGRVKTPSGNAMNSNFQGVVSNLRHIRK